MRALTRVLTAAILTGAASCSSDSDPLTTTDELASVPAGLRAAVQGTTVKLTWDAVPEATSYKVYMAEVGGVNRINVGELAGNMSHSHGSSVFDHPAGLIASRKYYFVVTAVFAGNKESRESCELTAKISANEGSTC